MRRPWTLSILLSWSTLACGGTAPPAAQTRVATSVDSGGDLAEAPPPPLDPSLPSDATLVGAIDAAAVMRHPLAVGIARAALARLDLVAVLGLDASRPVTFAVSSLDPTSRVALARVAALAPPVSSHGSGTAPSVDPSLYSRVAAHWRALTSPWLHVRIVVPVTAPDTWFAGVRPLVEELGLRKRRRAPPGMDGVACQETGGACVGFSHDAASAVVDAIVPAFFVYPVDDARRASGDLARAALVELARIRNARPGATTTAAPALAGALGRASWVPVRVAELAFASGVARSLDAISFGGVGARERAPLMAQALYEASQAVALAGGLAGAYFDRIEVSAEGAVDAPTLRMHAAAGPSAPPVVAVPIASVAVDTPFAAVDVANAWLASPALPGSRYSSSAQDHALDEAGPGSALIALPQWFALIARFATAGEAGDFVFPPGASTRFERTVSVFDDLGSDDATVRVGVLPAGTVEAVASCVLVEAPDRCTRRNRLRVGVVTPLEGGFVELERIGDRFVLVGGRDRTLVASRAVRIAPGPAGPVSARVTFPPEIARLVADMIEARGPVTWLPRGYDVALDVDATGGWNVVATPAP